MQSTSTMFTREEYERNQTICANCGEPKSVGLIVCWTCFKYIENPFKESTLDLKDWLKEQNNPNSVLMCPVDPQDALNCEACQ